MYGEWEMTSEWEKLEELSKDELIIELMHWKTLYSILRNEQDDSCPMPELERSDAGSGFEDFDPGEVTTDRWAERIALFAIAHCDDQEFWPCDLMDYGLTDQQPTTFANVYSTKADWIFPTASFSEGSEHELGTVPGVRACGFEHLRIRTGRKG